MALHSDYFNRKESAEPNPGLKSPPTTRPFAALSLVTSLLHQGTARVVEKLQAPLAAIRALANHLEDEAEVELWHRPDTGVLCFRITPPGVPEEQLDQLQEYVYAKIMAGAERSISVTRLEGNTVLRLVAISPSVTQQALMATISHVRAVAREMSARLKPSC